MDTVHTVSCTFRLACVCDKTIYAPSMASLETHDIAPIRTTSKPQTGIKIIIVGAGISSRSLPLLLTHFTHHP